MTPQKKGLVPDVEEQRVRAAVVGAEAAERELRDAVTAALLAGGSVREVARISGKSTNTIERWGRAGGWPSDAQKAEWEKARQEKADLETRMDVARKHAEYIEGADDAGP